MDALSQRAEVPQARKREEWLHDQKKIVKFVSIVTWTGTESQPKGRAGMGQTGWLQVVVDVPPYIHPLGLEDNLALSAVAIGIVV